MNIVNIRECAVSKQHLRSIHIAVNSRPMKRRTSSLFLVSYAVALIHICSVINEQVEHFIVVCKLHRKQERGISTESWHVYLCFIIEQQLSYLQVQTLNRYMQRRYTG